MLVDPKLSPNYNWDGLKVQKGVFYSPVPFNFSWCMDELEDFTVSPPYGVADNLGQIMEYLSNEDGHYLSGSGRYVLALTEVKKSEEPERGGWRWHKWGPYIGTQSPQSEYLVDEPEIDGVLVWEVVKLHG